MRVQHGSSQTIFDCDSSQRNSQDSRREGAPCSQSSSMQDGQLSVDHNHCSSEGRVHRPQHQSSTSQVSDISSSSSSYASRMMPRDEFLHAEHHIRLSFDTASQYSPRSASRQHRQPHQISEHMNEKRIDNDFTNVQEVALSKATANPSFQGAESCPSVTSMSVAMPMQDAPVLTTARIWSPTDRGSSESIVRNFATPSPSTPTALGVEREGSVETMPVLVPTHSYKRRSNTRSSARSSRGGTGNSVVRYVGPSSPLPHLQHRERDTGRDWDVDRDDRDRDYRDRDNGDNRDTDNRDNRYRDNRDMDTQNRADEHIVSRENDLETTTALRVCADTHITVQENHSNAVLDVSCTFQGSQRSADDSNDNDVMDHLYSIGSHAGTANEDEDDNDTSR